MEKISQILPASARTRKIDVSNSQPVRPGAPTWGRPVGRVTTAPAAEIEDKVSFSREAKTSAATAAVAEIATPTPEENYKKLGEMEQARKIQELANKFFMEAPTPQTSALSETTAENIQAVADKQEV